MSSSIRFGVHRGVRSCVTGCIFACRPPAAPVAEAAPAEMIAPAAAPLPSESLPPSPARATQALPPSTTPAPAPVPAATPAAPEGEVKIPAYVTDSNLITAEERELIVRFIRKDPTLSKGGHSFVLRLGVGFVVVATCGCVCVFVLFLCLYVCARVCLFPMSVYLCVCVCVCMFELQPTLGASPRCAWSCRGHQRGRARRRRCTSSWNLRPKSLRLLPRQGRLVLLAVRVLVDNVSVFVCAPSDAVQVVKKGK